MAEPGVEPKSTPELEPTQPQGCVGPTSQKAGTASACDGCPSQKACSSGKFREQSQYVSACLETIGKFILVLSAKGGVGKSTCAVQIAWGLSLAGYQVGILDVDICGPSVPRMVGKENAEVKRTSTGWIPVSVRDNLSVMSVGYLVEDQDTPLIWRGARITSLVHTFFTDVNWGDLDYLIIDTPPGTSDIQIALGQLLSNVDNTAVLVSTPQEVALRDVRKGIQFCRQAKLDILGMVENMSGFVCPCCNATSQIFRATSGGAEKVCRDSGLNLLAKIPLDPRLGEHADSGLPFPFTSKGPVGEALMTLVGKIAGKENLTFDHQRANSDSEDESLNSVDASRAAC